MAENVNINSNSIFQETKELLSNLVDGIVAESESFIKIGASQKQEEFVLSDQLPLNEAGDTLATHENRKHADESNVKPNESLKSSFTKELLNQKLSGQFETTKEESNDKDYKYVPNPKSISLDDGSDTTTDEKNTGSLLDSKPHSPVDGQHLNLVQLTTGLLWQLIDSKEKADQLLICQNLLTDFLEQIQKVLQISVTSNIVVNTLSGQQSILNILGVLTNMLTSCLLRSSFCEQLAKNWIVFLDICNSLLVHSNQLELQGQISCMVLLCLINISLDKNGLALLKLDQSLQENLDIIRKVSETPECKELACELYETLWGQLEQDEEPKSKRKRSEDYNMASLFTSEG